MAINPKLVSKFWSLVQQRGPDDCWEWQGNRGRHGYGRLTFNYKPLWAHRLAYEFEHGALPENKVICHKCDNPPCVNPKHLFAGSQTDNVLDVWSKGRGVNPPLHKGETHHKAKITAADAQEIKAAYDAAPIVGNRKKFGVLKAFERRFGLSKRQVQQIAYGKSWKGCDIGTD